MVLVNIKPRLREGRHFLGTRRDLVAENTNVVVRSHLIKTRRVWRPSQISPVRGTRLHQPGTFG